MQIECTQARRRHKIGRAHVRHVRATPPITTNRGAESWLYIGPDECGRVLLVVHVMPHHLREGN